MSSEAEKKEKALALYRRKLLERREIQAKLETCNLNKILIIMSNTYNSHQCKEKLSNYKKI